MGSTNFFLAEVRPFHRQLEVTGQSGVRWSFNSLGGSFFLRMWQYCAEVIYSCLNVLFLIHRRYPDQHDGVAGTLRLQSIKNVHKQLLVRLSQNMNEVFWSGWKCSFFYCLKHWCKNRMKMKTKWKITVLNLDVLVDYYSNLFYACSHYSIILLLITFRIQNHVKLLLKDFSINLHVTLYQQAYSSIPILQCRCMYITHQHQLFQKIFTASWLFCPVSIISCTQTSDSIKSAPQTSCSWAPYHDQKRSYDWHSSRPTTEHLRSCWMVYMLLFLLVYFPAMHP